MSWLSIRLIQIHEVIKTAVERIGEFINWLLTLLTTLAIIATGAYAFIEILAFFGFLTRYTCPN